MRLFSFKPRIINASLGSALTLSLIARTAEPCTCGNPPREVLTLELESVTVDGVTSDGSAYKAFRVELDAGRFYMTEDLDGPAQRGARLFASPVQSPTKRVSETYDEP